MKKIIKLFIYILLLCNLFVLTGCDDEIDPLDNIDLYQITIDPRNDGTLDMNFKITWTVLNDDKEGPLEWVKIGIPNYHVDEIKGLTSNIDKIEYYTDDGAFIRIDFKKKYYKGESLTFEFSTHQSYMYTFDEECCYYEYQPGWFDEIKVTRAIVLWNNANVLSSNATISDNGYFVWDYSLDYGKTIDVKIKYNLSTFTNLQKDGQYTDDYYPPERLVRLFIILGIIAFIVIVLIIIVSRAQDPYLAHRGFCGTRVYYNPLYHHYYFSHGVNKKGERIVNPTSSTWKGGSSGGSCACACACACAGGGRAGCSRKDFNHTTIKSDDVIKELNK